MRYIKYISILLFLCNHSISAQQRCVFSGTLTVSQDTSICTGDSVNLFVYGAINHQWSPVVFVSDSNLQSIYAFPTQTTTFEINVDDVFNSCDTTVFINVFVYPEPNISAGEDTLICPGTDLQLQAMGGISYTWLNTHNLSNYLIDNPTIDSLELDTTYIVEGVDLNNCISRDTVNVSLFDNAKAFAGFDVNICDGQSYLLNASGGINYSWFPIDYVNHSNSNNPLAFPEDDMEFIVEVTDLNGCKDSDTMKIGVFKISIDNDTIICSGDSVQVKASGDPAAEITWTPLLGISDPNSFEPWISPLTTTSYTATAIESITGCASYSSILLQVPKTEAIIDSDTLTGCDGLYIDFINSSNTNLNFSWNFSDNTTSNDIITSKSVAFDSNLDVQLVVTDNIGCSDTAYLSIISDSFETYFNFDEYIPPNVFTPNGDSLNDLFLIDIPGKIYECTELVIYNKWGEIQFSSLGNNLYWDGYTNTGTLATEGIYYYSLKLNNFSKMGFVQLFR